LKLVKKRNSDFGTAINPNNYYCGGSERYNEPEETDKVNNTELKNKTFKTVGFTGKWKNLIGDPSEPFTMMLFGSPGSGKSTLVGIFQGTKTGSYRGSQEYEHNVDVNINCEAGTAYIKKSRFGGNGEMERYEGRG